MKTSCVERNPIFVQVGPSRLALLLEPPSSGMTFKSWGPPSACWESFTSDVTLPFEPFDEGSVTRYAVLQVRCGISSLVRAVSQTANELPVERLGLLTHPWSLVKRRNHCNRRWILVRLVLDFQSLFRDYRNWYKPFENQHQYSQRNSQD